MVSIGAIMVEPLLIKTFYAELRPISDKWVPESLQVCGLDQEQTLQFAEPQGMMESFAAWITVEAGRRPFFISDNNDFDWHFVNWYFHQKNRQDPTGVIADFSQAILINPQNAFAYNNRGLLKNELGDRSGAVVDYKCSNSDRTTAATGCHRIVGFGMSA
jgi:hypothetical protein